MSYHINQQLLADKYILTRKQTEILCEPLEIEDYIPQPMLDVSPPKWHLGHTTWFFEQFILVNFLESFKVFNNEFAYIFNSFYNNMGDRILRKNRGKLTRPTVKEVYNYRKYIDDEMSKLFKKALSQDILQLIEIGLNHEEQHQELFVYDLKYIFGIQPLFPTYNNNFSPIAENYPLEWIKISGGIKEIGAKGTKFAFDNELPCHEVFIHNFEISNKLVSNQDFIEFIEDDSYNNFNLWHSEGWDYIKKEKIVAPLYWKKIDNVWHTYTLNGFDIVDNSLPLMHISFYEAFAFAEWKKKRLPNEFEWEVASKLFKWGQLWEWTQSQYLPYPGFSKVPGALGEYNGKFMLNQIVLKGASVATPKGHERNTYRNFFHSSSRWIYSGIRLAK